MVSEIKFEYNDEIYYDNGGHTPIRIFKRKEKAERYQWIKIIEWLKDPKRLELESFAYAGYRKIISESFAWFWNIDTDNDLDIERKIADVFNFLKNEDQLIATAKNAINWGAGDECIPPPFRVYEVDVDDDLLD